MQRVSTGSWSAGWVYKLWRHSQKVDSWREGISFCMYNFRKVTGGAARHQRSGDASRERGRRSGAEDQSGRAVVFMLPYFLTPTPSANIYGTVCQRVPVASRVRLHLNRVEKQRLHVIQTNEATQQICHPFSALTLMALSGSSQHLAAQHLHLQLDVYTHSVFSSWRQSTASAPIHKCVSRLRVKTN